MSNLLKRFAVFFLIVCLSSSLFGCGSDSKGNDTANNTSGAISEGTVKRTQEPVKIVYPDCRVGNHNEAADFAKNIEEFNELYKGKYEIVVEEIPGAEIAYLQKLKMLNAADNLPAIFSLGLDPSLAEIIIKNDKVVDLKPYIDQCPEWNNLLVKESVDYNIVNGKIIAKPSATTSCVGIFYNKELFEKAGINEFPKTWDDFWTVCEQLKSKGITPISLHTSDIGWCSNLMLNAMLATSDEGMEFLKIKYPTDFQKPVIIDAVRNLQKLFKYAPKDAVGATYPVAANNFCSGKAAMIPNGPWMKTVFSDTKSSPEGFADKVGVATFPEGIMIDNESLKYGDALSNKYPKEVIEGCVEWFKFVSSPAKTKERVLSRGELAPKLTLTDDDRKNLDPLTLAIFDIQKEMKISAPVFQMKWDTLTQNETIPTELPALALGKITPEEYAKKMSESAKKFAEQNSK